ncbi:unnamed protein product [Heligmosomoides polygyrus]|uniref:Uncharacterized protein n=1 Tax=Heligmosomoides polygyrus TaxID=6339 RepID=A0A3P7XI70_HELPZ|nr:unnamed protein product [Heligmosomoides polygyrus]
MLNEFREQHKATPRSEIENEMTILEESSAKENRSAERITVLEMTPPKRHECPAQLASSRREISSDAGAAHGQPMAVEGVAPSPTPNRAIEQLEEKMDAGMKDLKRYFEEGIRHLERQANGIWKKTEEKLELLQRKENELKRRPSTPPPGPSKPVPVFEKLPATVDLKDEMDAFGARR